jgi:hypothetical protein
MYSNEPVELKLKKHDAISLGHSQSDIGINELTMYMIYVKKTAKIF